MNEPELHPGRIELFGNAWLERLTVMSVFWFALTWALMLPTMALAGWDKVSLAAGLALVGGGLLFWSIFEYATHRFVFHARTKSPRTARLLFLLHGNHHAQPDDRLRNLMPPIVSIPVALVIWSSLFAAFGHAGTWIVLGFLSGYVTYDMVHYACHQWPMRGPLGLALKRHHMRHHHVNADGNYAITGLFWDGVFGSKITSLRRTGPVAAQQQD